MSVRVDIEASARMAVFLGRKASNSQERALEPRRRLSTPQRRAFVRTSRGGTAQAGRPTRAKEDIKATQV